MIRTKYRPYPEDDTIVFYIVPEYNDVYFCWCLPNWSEMDNIIANRTLYEYTKDGKEYVGKIRAWKDMRLEHFGFTKDEIGNWTPNPLYSGDTLLQKQESEKATNTSPLHLLESPLTA